MKKNPAPRKAAPKSTRKTVKKTNTGGETVRIHRIFIISACLTLFAFGVFYANKQTVEKSVAGASIARGLFFQTTIILPNDIPQAKAYNIYYKQTDEKEFTNAVRNIPANGETHTISYLKKGSTYQYLFAALDENGKEFLFTEQLPVTDMQPM